MKPLYCSDGFFAYRTKRLTYESAQAFACCVRANRARFFNVALETSDRAKSERRFFVTFQPINSDRMSDIAEREQAARIQRADREGGEYVYFLDTDCPRPFYRVFNPLGGETYELDNSTCSCPDFTYRCSRTPGYGMRCKHQIEMMRRFDCGELTRLHEVRVPRLYANVRYCDADLARAQSAAA